MTSQQNKGLAGEILESEITVFWDEMSKHLPKSMEREALGDEKIFVAFKAIYPKIRAFHLSQIEAKVLGVIEENKKTIEKFSGDGFVTPEMKNFAHITLIDTHLAITRLFEGEK